MNKLQRLLATGTIILGVGLMAISCSRQPDTADTTPPPPPRGSADSPVRAVNPRMADKAIMKRGGVVSSQRRNP